MKSMKINIIGVKIDNINLDQSVKLVDQWLSKKTFDYTQGKHYIVTPNPEFIVAAQDDHEFKNILNKADLAIPDGMGLKLPGKITNTVAGVDLMEQLIKLSTQQGYTIGLLGGKKGVAVKLKERLIGRYPNLKVIFADFGGEINSDGKEVNKYSVYDPSIHHTQYSIPPMDILFVAFGQVKQEKWIYKNLPNSKVKVMMGVGGAFDYLSGEIPRAPKWIRSLGFEWLFRLFVQPWRIKRFGSLIKFVFLVLTSAKT